MARLVINPGSPTAWEIQLRPGLNLLGRGFANDFKIEDPSVSSSHCQILVEQGQVVIKDLGSTNGTFVNRAPVKEAVLHPGQSIHLGGVEMVFQAGPPANVNVSKTEVIPAPPIARAVAAIPAMPSAAKPVGAIPLVAKPVTPPGPPPIATGIPVPVATSIATTPKAERPPPLALATPIAPRVSASAAVAAAEPSVPPPIAPEILASPVEPIQATGGGKCKHHPKTPGRYLCNTCHHYYCELCVSSRTVSGVKHKTCRHCGTECVPVQVQLRREVEAGFFARLPGAFTYPFRGAGVIIILIGILIVTGIRVGGYMARLGSIRGVGGGIILAMLSTGYLFTFLQSIVHSTVAGDRELPDPPGFGNFVEDILLPFLRLLGLFAFCFAPAIGLGIWLLVSGEGSGGLAIAIIAALVLGGLYFPMAFLAVAILDSVGAANPLVILPSILKVPLEYLVTVVLIGIVVGLRPLGDFIIGAVFPQGLSTKSMGELFAMIGARAFWGLTSFYLLIVAVHILGLLYVTKKQKLGWLDR